MARIERKVTLVVTLEECEFDDLRDMVDMADTSELRDSLRALIDEREDDF